MDELTQSQLTVLATYPLARCIPIRMANRVPKWYKIALPLFENQTEVSVFSSKRIIGNGATPEEAWHSASLLVGAEMLVQLSI